MLKLIVNADDLGLNAAIDAGIFQAHREGIVTSASLLVNGRCAQAAALEAQRVNLPLGVHLCATNHLSPVASSEDVRWLAPGGRMRKDWVEFSASWVSQMIPERELQFEFRAQIDQARNWGVSITHLNTHQHIHLLPGVSRIVETLANELNVPVRWPKEAPSKQWAEQPFAALKSLVLIGLGNVQNTARSQRIPCVGIFESGKLNEQTLLQIIDRLPSEGTIELVAHPGQSPGVVPEDPTWQYQWETELAALTSPSVKNAISRRGIELTPYPQPH